MGLRERSAYMGAYVEGSRGVLGGPKRYSRDGLLLRGNGTLHMEEGRLRFEYTGIDRELVIPLHTVAGADVTDRHLGRRPVGQRVLVVKWRHKGRVLAAGFALRRDAELWQAHLRAYARRP